MEHNILHLLRTTEKTIKEKTKIAKGIVYSILQLIFPFGYRGKKCRNFFESG